MKTTVTININECTGVITKDNDEFNIIYDISLVDYKVSVYSKVRQRIETEEIISYNLNLIKDSEHKPIVLWLIRGLHGIPQDERNNTKSDNQSDSQ